MLRSILPFFVTAALGAVHTVEVGESGLVFEPQTLTAVPGDMIVFELYPSHNVVQGNYGSPCQSNDNGFYSGPFSNTNNGAKRFVINVTSNDPVYYYCSVQKHCENGMVGGINVPTSGQTIDAYKQAAASVQQSQTPGQLRGGQLLDESQVAALSGNATSSSASTSASASASSASASSAASASASGSASRSASASASAASASPSSGAALVSPVQMGGVAIVFGAAAWLF